MLISSSINALSLFTDILMTTNINMYYNAKINGGTLSDATQLQDGELLDNKKALRNNLAQQLLHEQMVDMQYNK